VRSIASIPQSATTIGPWGSAPTITAASRSPELHAHSSDDDQPFQLIVITDSGDRDHDVHPARGALGGQHDVVSDRYH